MFNSVKELIEDRELDRKKTDNKELPSEVNFLILPFFSLSRKDAYQRQGLKYEKQVTRDGKKQTITWKVSASNEYGYRGHTTSGYLKR